MDSEIINGDIIVGGSGDILQAQGADAIFRRGELLMNMRKGSFYPNPDMGVQLSGGDFSDPERLELLLNEALVSVDGLTAAVESVSADNAEGAASAIVKLKYRGRERKCEVKSYDKL